MSDSSGIRLGLLPVEKTNIPVQELFEELRNVFMSGGNNDLYLLDVGTSIGKISPAASSESIMDIGIPFNEEYLYITNISACASYSFPSSELYRGVAQFTEALHSIRDMLPSVKFRVHESAPAPIVAYKRRLPDTAFLRHDVEIVQKNGEVTLRVGDAVAISGEKVDYVYCLCAVQCSNECLESHSNQLEFHTRKDSLPSPCFEGMHMYHTICIMLFFVDVYMFFFVKTPKTILGGNLRTIYFML
jgi:hypothetical protein